MEYSLAEVEVYIKAIADQRKREARLQLTLLRIAQANKEGYERAVRQLFGVGDD